jgi:NADPH:quinone reductase-like Zn-dependent oxidoreductase
VKTIFRRAYGSPAALQVEDTAPPETGDDGVLVRVQAASLNRVDWYHLTGTPYVGRPMMGLRKPKSPTFGTDFAGTVEVVGRDVTQFKGGDEVFGRSSRFAEVVLADAAVALKPTNLTFDEAAAVPLAALTALQGLRDQGQLQPGQKVLINGASGGVGTFAVQIAKALGAEVTAVCSTRNIELVRSLGADRVVDYTREDFTRTAERYDVLFDNAGSRSWSACKRVLTPNATVVLVGGPKRSRVLGPMGHLIAMKLAAKFGSRRAAFFIADLNQPDLESLRDLIEAGQVKPVIERRYAFSEVADALRYLGEGHTQGKLVITM